MTDRDEKCVPAMHQHIGQCTRAGYANGRADALDEVEEAIQRLVGEIEDDYGHGVSDTLDAVRGLR